MGQETTSQSKPAIYGLHIHHTNRQTGEQFTALLSGPRGLFSRAAQNPDIAPLAGADLFNALVNKGACPIYAECRNKNGDYHDAQDGTPARREWNAYKRLSAQSHMQNGLPHDGMDGSPAVRNWYENGRLREECHFLNGQTHDGANGEPAIQSWDENGTLMRYVNKAAGIRTTDPALLRQIQNKEKSRSQVDYTHNDVSPA